MSVDGCMKAGCAGIISLMAATLAQYLQIFFLFFVLMKPQSSRWRVYKHSCIVKTFPPNKCSDSLVHVGVNVWNTSFLNAKAHILFNFITFSSLVSLNLYGFYLHWCYCRKLRQSRSWSCPRTTCAGEFSFHHLTITMIFSARAMHLDLKNVENFVCSLILQFFFPLPGTLGRLRQNQLAAETSAIFSWTCMYIFSIRQLVPHLS